MVWPRSGRPAARRDAARPPQRAEFAHEQARADPGAGRAARFLCSGRSGQPRQSRSPAAGKPAGAVEAAAGAGGIVRLPPPGAIDARCRADRLRPASLRGRAPAAGRGGGDRSADGRLRRRPGPRPSRGEPDDGGVRAAAAAGRAREQARPSPFDRADDRQLDRGASADAGGQGGPRGGRRGRRPARRSANRPSARTRS